ncbi:unnamed protein product [Urochloa decumbens]|uniref:Interferon-related developmental regulator N-terminal domain-containing protein n=1 Tax=Urochloa decumbens TaxID=240449 RepID=A0ABC9D773_9POAL
MAGNGEELDKFERIDAFIEDLQDRNGRYCWPKIKRSPATREAAMAGIVGELEGHHLPLESLDMRCLTIFALAGVSIKKGTPREACLAYRAVGLLLLTLRDGSPCPLLDKAFPTLSRAIQFPDAGAPPMLVAAAIDCLAAASFAGARRAREARRSMETVWRVAMAPTRLRSAKLKKTSPVVVAAAVYAWTFLLSIVAFAADTQQRKKADRTSSWSAAMASLMEMLDADDRRVRMAAGEALAVCAELNFLTDKDMGTLKAKVSDLAAESAGKRADNSLLRQQQELFGQIAAFLDHGEPPVASWEWHDMMKVSTWVRLVQLNFLRKFLGDGFLEHVRGNPLLKEAFSFGRVEGKPLSIQKERRMSIDELLQNLERNRDSSWEYGNIVCLPRTYGLNEGLPEKLLQLGWH